MYNALNSCESLSKRRMGVVEKDVQWMRSEIGKIFFRQSLEALYKRLTCIDDNVAILYIRQVHSAHALATCSLLLVFSSDLRELCKQ